MDVSFSFFFALLEIAALFEARSRGGYFRERAGKPMVRRISIASGDCAARLETNGRAARTAKSRDSSL
jgi:hypothetical protein